MQKALSISTAIGMYLRNYILLPDCELYRLFVLSGITGTDKMSAIMIDTWQKELNKQPSIASKGCFRI